MVACTLIGVCGRSTRLSGRFFPLGWWPTAPVPDGPSSRSSPAHWLTASRRRSTQPPGPHILSGKDARHRRGITRFPFSVSRMTAGNEWFSGTSGSCSTWDRSFPDLADTPGFSLVQSLRMPLLLLDREERLTFQGVSVHTYTIGRDGYYLGKEVGQAFQPDAAWTSGWKA
jgi:hypothetical protein